MISRLQNRLKLDINKFHAQFQIYQRVCRLLNDHVMEQARLDSYSDLFKDKSILSFFNKIPWCLTGPFQEHEVLKKTLIAEHGRYLEYEKITFSIITPCWNTPAHLLEELIYSVMLQSWHHWQLILVDNGSTQIDHIEVIKRFSAKDSRIKFIESDKNLGISGGRNKAIEHATGDYICILDHDDIIHPQVLGAFFKTLNQYPGTNFIYTNELNVNHDCKIIKNYFYKPEFSMAGLRRTNYICHFTAIHRNLYDQVKVDEHTWFQSEFDGCEDHDLFLRIGMLSETQAFHLPIFSYYWRGVEGSTALSIETKSYVFERAKKMLEKHYEVLGYLNESVIKTHPSENVQGRFFSIKSQPKNNSPVAVIIPYKDQVKYTLDCLHSLLKQDYQKNCDVFLIDNNSCEIETSKKIDDFIVKNEGAFSSITKLNYSGAFNYGRMHNWVIKEYIKTPYILFLNNDVELYESNSISTMIAELEINNDLGFSGIRLMYPNSSKIQFGGFKISIDTRNLGFFKPSHIHNNPNEYPYDERIVPGITFACCLMKTSVFEEIGGFSDVCYPNNYSDLDVCLAGKRIEYQSFYFGSISGVHHESISRILPDDHLEKLMSSMKFMNEFSYLTFNRHVDGINLLRREDDIQLHEQFLPKRYEIADRVNNFIKKWVYPIHRAIKKYII